jgi:hypothetical protein
MIGHARSGHSRKALDGELDSPPSPPPHPSARGRPLSLSRNSGRFGHGFDECTFGHGFDEIGPSPRAPNGRTGPCALSACPSPEGLTQRDLMTCPCGPNHAPRTGSDRDQLGFELHSMAISSPRRFLRGTRVRFVAHFVRKGGIHVSTVRPPCSEDRPRSGYGLEEMAAGAVVEVGSIFATVTTPRESAATVVSQLEPSLRLNRTKPRSPSPASGPHPVPADSSARSGTRIVAPDATSASAGAGVRHRDVLLERGFHAASPRTKARCSRPGLLRGRRLRHLVPAD